ncbi:growth hormone secretagogue receptor type 1-like [Oratosquilla oratoria]|uniref:growth hormone secretagogue receptor type 1-like n=1 Tax=Oratosquilla oratoria TaxID=337810 RepID=UPI003F75F7F7
MEGSGQDPEALYDYTDSRSVGLLVSGGVGTYDSEFREVTSSFSIFLTSTRPSAGVEELTEATNSSLLVETLQGINHTVYLNATAFERADPVFPEYIRVMSTLVCSVVFVVGVVGNVLVPVVILRNRDMRNSTNYFLINLSVADLLVLLVCLPTVVVELHSPPEVWVLGSTMCKIVPYVESTVLHASVLSLVVISFERYQVISRPLQAGYRCTRTKAAIAIFTIWVTAFLSAAPILAIQTYTHVDYYDGSVQPVCLSPVILFWPRFYIVSASIFFFFLPLVLLVALYSIIARQLLADTYDLTHKKENPQMRSRKQVVVMLATVVLFFFLCILPIRVLFLWILAVPSENITALGIEGYYNLLYFCRVMAYINSSINPVLYNMTSTKFRNAFRRVFSCWASARPAGYHPGLSCSSSYANASSVSNNLRLLYGGNSCSMVYKGLYVRGAAGHTYSFSSNTSSSSQVTRQTSLTPSQPRLSTSDSLV